MTGNSALRLAATRSGQVSTDRSIDPSSLTPALALGSIGFGVQTTHLGKIAAIRRDDDGFLVSRSVLDPHQRFNAS